MNMIATSVTLTKEAEAYLKDLVAELEVPEGRYEQARKRYKSLGEWLHREESTVARFNPQIYAQGSFRLGTAIKPSTEEEEYDVDSICLCRSLGKRSVSQRDLKTLVGREIDAYRKANSMGKPLKEGRRCWVLSYADTAQFHMDIVPAVPNDHEQRALMETARLSTEWASTAVGITDNETPGYETITDAWQRSNPKGYSQWFKRRTTVLLERRQKASADSVRASVETMPTFKLKLPLQSAIMILKGHRNHMFADRSECGPISIIITTLAAHAYNGEETIGSALVSILARMDEFITYDQFGAAQIPNPTDPLENFADKWVAHPERQVAFYEWLGQARQDFQALAALSDRQRLMETASRSVGAGFAQRAQDRAYTPSRPSFLTNGFVRDEAQARSSAVKIQGDNRSA